MELQETSDRPLAKRGRRGRPRKELDPRRVEELSSLGCTQEEIAELLGCSQDTLSRRCAASMRKGWAQRNLSLRRSQFRAAKRGNAVMLVFLGKNYLHQSDQPPPDHASNALDELLAEFRKQNEHLKNADAGSKEHE